MSTNKRHLHHWVTVVRRLKTWQLIIILILMAFVSATLLRVNNLGMLERRAAVTAADEKGDETAIRASLSELQQYVNAHMNTDLGSGVYLSKSYDRARAAALEAAGSATNPNSAVYQQASVECQSRFTGGVASFRNDYVQCVVARVAALNAAGDPLSQLQLPKADLYRFDFISPLWSPDAAGFTFLLTSLLALIILLKIAFVLIAKLILRRHAKREK